MVKNGESVRCTYAVAFFCRESKKSKKDGTSPIEMSITLNGERLFVNLPKRMMASDFSRMVRSRKSNELQTFLNDWRKKVDGIVDYLSNAKKPITSSNIKYIILNGYSSDEYSIDRLWKEFYDRNKDGYSLCMIRKWKLTHAQLCEFFGKEKNIVDIDDYQLEDFKRWIEKRFKDSTTKNYCSRVKQLFKYAYNRGYIKQNIQASIKLKRGEITIEYLEPDELDLIYNHHFGIDRIQKAADLFLFQCYSALSYVDLSSVDIANTQPINGSSEMLLLCGRRGKTNVKYTSVLLPRAVEILKKYGGRLPTLSNQRLNGYLKEVQDLCGIKKNLHSHLSRKTYGTMMLSTAKIPIEVVSKMLGHANIRTTQSTYAFLKDEVVGDVVVKALTHQVK